MWHKWATSIDGREGKVVVGEGRINKVTVGEDLVNLGAKAGVCASLRNGWESEEVCCTEPVPAWVPK